MRIVLTVVLYVLALVGLVDIFGQLRLLSHIGWKGYREVWRTSHQRTELLEGKDIPEDRMMQVLDGSKLTEERKAEIVNSSKVAEKPLGRVLQDVLKKNVVKTEDMSTWPKSEFLTIVTNVPGSRKEIQELVGKTKIYDVSFMVYSQEFADTYHYPKEYVEALDPSIDVIEFRFVTNGAFQDLYLNVLLKPNLGLDLPKEETFVVRPLRLRFPKRTEKFRAKTDEEVAWDEKHGWIYENYYQQNIFLATKGYRIEKKGAMLGTMLMEYSRIYIPGYEYVSISLGANSFVQKILEQPNPTLWIKNTSGADYTARDHLNPDDFLKINIPRSLIEKALPLIQEIDLYSFTDVQRQQGRKAA